MKSVSKPSAASISDSHAPTFSVTITIPGPCVAMLSV